MYILLKSSTACSRAWACSSFTVCLAFMACVTDGREGWSQKGRKGGSKKREDEWNA